MRFKKLPSVLSFNRGHVASDALMFNIMADATQDQPEKLTPLLVVRHGVRGTQNYAGGKEDKEVSNVQTTESAKLATGAVGMLTRFSIAYLDMDAGLNSCSGKDQQEARRMRDAITGFIGRAVVSRGFEEVALRYARNIANGRWLWRNLSLADAIEVSVIFGDTALKFDALSISRRSFGDYSDNEKLLAAEIANQMRGNSTGALQVEARMRLRGECGDIEVFPSQNFLAGGKEKGYARSLYCVNVSDLADPDVAMPVMGQAALRDQKVTNALRTIDTWYPTYGEEGEVLAVEPQGASLSLQVFLRGGKSSALEIMKGIEDLDPNSDDGKFMIAVFGRGGVFGESDKKEKSGEATEE